MPGYSEAREEEVDELLNKLKEKVKYLLKLKQWSDY